MGFERKCGVQQSILFAWIPTIPNNRHHDKQTSIINHNGLVGKTYNNIILQNIAV